MRIQYVDLMREHAVRYHKIIDQRLFRQRVLIPP
jgi:hypothetical protein